jgi:hypothetical protein
MMGIYMDNQKTDKHLKRRSGFGGIGDKIDPILRPAPGNSASL